jgi:cold shock CspA family protein
MARSQETYNKKEVRNRKEKKRKDKAQKRIERRSSPKEGSSFDDMIAYVDENGRITSEPPDPTSRTKVKVEDIEISIPRQSSEKPAKELHVGIITLFNNSKGYGFIRDLSTQKSLFVHINDMEESMSESDRVTYEVEQGIKGLKAIHVKKAVS